MKQFLDQLIFGTGFIIVSIMLLMVWIPAIILVGLLEQIGWIKNDGK